MAKDMSAQWESYEPFLLAILKEPDDPATYGVFADWLTEHEDPLGKFIHLQLQLEDESLTSTERQEITETENRLLAKHQPQWLGELYEHLQNGGTAALLAADLQQNYKFAFATGFLGTLQIPSLLPEFSEALAQSPQTRFLQRLVIHALPDGGCLRTYPVDRYADWGEEDVPGLQPLSGVRFDNLRDFEVRNDAHSTSAPGLVEIISQMPRLETLHLKVPGVSTHRLFALPMPQLRSLTVNNLRSYPLERLARNASLTHLEAIRFIPHARSADDWIPYLNVEGFIEICDSPHLSSLEQLELCGSDINIDGIEALAESRLLPQLRQLNLSYGEMDDDAAFALAETGLPNLEELNVSYNRLTDAGLEALEDTGVDLISSGQYSEDDFQYDDEFEDGDWE